MKRLNSPRPLFFARKFEEFVSQEAVNTLDFRLYGKYPTGSPSINSYWENIWSIQDFRKTDNSKVNPLNKLKNHGRVFILSEDLEQTDQSETSIMKLAYAKNKIITDKKRRHFLRIFK